MRNFGLCKSNPEALEERSEAVANFRLSTGHDCLGGYFHGLGLAADVVCPLCGYARTYGDHLLQCTSINTRQTKSSVCTGRLGDKWSRSQHGRWINE
ncbi:hypothetical protein TNCV_331571 [Trichonephila clavipes]|nr:hypothetical protein TNCV_331571 [Trichonephila clavipes]